MVGEDALSDIYNDLKRLARNQRRRIWSKKGLGTRSIVHEAYLKLLESKPDAIPNNQEFLLLASKAMRSVLVDNARHWHRQKRGGDLCDLSLDNVELVSAQHTDELIELDKALNQLAATNQRLVEIVDCRFFGGLSIQETAQALSISAATVKRDWTVARTILYQHLFDDDNEKSNY